jgi:hypothetical protein
MEQKAKRIFASPTYRVSFPQQELGKVRAILARNTRDQSHFSIFLILFSHRYYYFLCCVWVFALLDADAEFSGVCSMLDLDLFFPIAENLFQRSHGQHLWFHKMTMNLTRWGVAAGTRGVFLITFQTKSKSKPIE